MSGISHAGAEPEARFRQITSAVKPEHSRDGDARFADRSKNVEVKKESGGTINQVRASKYHVLVIWHEGKKGKHKETGWYVVPAHMVVTKLKGKRGQHQPNPFICATLSINDIDTKCFTPEHALKRRVLDAMKEDDQFTALKEMMTSLNEETEVMAERYKKSVSTYLEMPKGL